MQKKARHIATDPDPPGKWTVRADIYFTKVIILKSLKKVNWTCLKILKMFHLKNFKKVQLSFLKLFTNIPKRQKLHHLTLHVAPSSGQHVNVSNN
ncbi:hypothetical protein L3Q82_007495 [Scortum barcoo]|uniref:Uncharacterized protein n=1 Tax=Scortum barcoo TaxID=214431 RepID=A0ACB8WP28_9TELE|nr:hypothetical protein L3Q82_007495 [Scortum barcoo]